MKNASLAHNRKGRVDRARQADAAHERRDNATLTEAQRAGFAEQGATPRANPTFRGDMHSPAEDRSENRALTQNRPRGDQSRNRNDEARRANAGFGGRNRNWAHDWFGDEVVAMNTQSVDDVERRPNAIGIVPRMVEVLVWHPLCRTRER